MIYSQNDIDAMPLGDLLKPLSGKATPLRCMLAGGYEMRTLGQMRSADASAIAHRGRLNNKSGVIGVKQRGTKWVAQFGTGKSRKEGQFDTFEDAVAARREMEKA